MTTLVALVLASALAHAVWNAMLKGKTGDPLAASAGLSLSWVVLGIPLALAFEAPAPAAYPYLAGSIGVHLVYFSLLNAAYRQADLSLVYPIARGTPPLIVACAGWLVVGDEVSAIGVTGVVLVAIGVLGLGLVRAPGAPEGRRRRGLALAFATAALIASYTLVDGVGVRVSGSPIGYAIWLSVIQGGLFGVGAMVYGGQTLRREVWARKRDGVIAGALSAGGYAIALHAMSEAPIALIAALRETSVVFAAIIGAVFLREPLGRRRIAAAIVVAAGVIAIQAGA